MKPHFSLSLRASLLLTYLVLIAVSLGVLAWRIGASLDASRFSETKRDQEGRAVLAASAAGDWLANYRDGRIDDVELWNEASTLSREISQPVAILDHRGGVLVDSEHPNETGRDESNLPEVVAGLQGKPTSVIRFDSDDQGDALFSVAPVRFNRELVGVIRLELPMNLVNAASQQLWLRVIAATTFAAFATIIVSLLFARALTAPIAQINRAARAMANGDLKQRLRMSRITELGQLASSFNFMAGRISRVMEDQRAFVANAAHELRTPLTTIRLRAEALEEGARNDREVSSQFLSDIVSETDRLARLVDQLLDLSRIETGIVTLRRELISIESVANSVVHELSASAAQAGLSLEIKAHEALPLVSGDPDQIRQVFVNLISNAIKFTPSGGSIVLNWRLTSAKGQPDLAKGDWIAVEVRDSGVGISPDQLPHIFDRFYRGEKGAPQPGTGLGLAIVKSIIDAHRGRIWVTSEIGKGTATTFELPVRQAA